MSKKGILFFMISPFLILLLLGLLEWITGIHDYSEDSRGLGLLLTYLAYIGGLGWLITMPVGAVFLALLKENSTDNPRK